MSGALKPVLALAARSTSSHSFLMRLAFQVTARRSLPSVPPPRMTEKPDGVGAVFQVPMLL